MLNKLAKKDKTIYQHNEDLYNCLDTLYSLGYIGSKSIYDLVRLCCTYHDYGKANAEFQKRVAADKKIKFNEDKEVSHNVLSMYFINKEDFDNYDDYLRVLFAVGYHHDYCDVQYVIDNKKDLIKELLSPFETYKITRRILYKMSEIADTKESILIKGLLHKCDYCGSAGCTVELPNDFLSGCMDRLLQKWQLNNKSANWNEMQSFCADNTDKNIIVIAQTGMGKTEGGLKWIGNNKGFFILPLKTAINAMYDRIKDNIVTSNAEDRLGILHSESINHVIEKEEEKRTKKEYETGNEIYDIISYNEKGKKLSMPLTISTMDQLFDFVFKYNGYEMKLATFSYSKIVIDEIQMYGAELLAYMIYGIEKILEMGGKVAILTATLPPFIRDLFGDKFEYKEFTNDLVRHNVRVLHNKINANDIVEKYIENKNKGVSNKILVICNTIKSAQKLYDEICESVEENEVNMLHTRFTKNHRAEKERAILRVGATDYIGNEIWITTSVVEASLDIDFDYLFTELQDINSLFQRMGRCNRKGVKPCTEPNCFVYDEIDSNLIKNGKRGFIDCDIFNISKEAISNLNGVVTESEKLQLINKYLTTENMRNSNFMRDYESHYRHISNLELHDTDYKDIELRHISSVDIVPKDIYFSNEEFYENLKNSIDEEKDPIKKIKLIDEICKNIISIPRYDYINSEKDLKYFKVIDCEYDDKKGFVAKKQDKGYCTFW